MPELEHGESFVIFELLAHKLSLLVSYDHPDFNPLALSIIFAWSAPISVVMYKR
jgi:hypothetical protein